ncbi:MAG: hypothetical protein IKH80_02440 [Bacteroidaceae bacterium]|nr:hypothetical protein [Bacteroidaceae bacterium]
MKKKHIIKKPSTRVHAYRCTDEVWLQLKEHSKECGISLNRYLTETGLKHHPRKRLTKEEVDALNSLAFARTDLIKISSVLQGKTEAEKLKLFKSEKFMAWWIKASAELIQHWYSIEENITSPVLTKERSAL